jgi:hypothetical protein
MRKLILITAFVLASVSAQAGSRGLVLAANDEPVAVQPDAATTAAKTDVKADAKTDCYKSDTSKTHYSKSSRKTYAHTWRGDEAKARHIAAKYGVYW